MPNIHINVQFNILEECKMIKLIKKGGLRERANRSRKYHGSENTETTLKPNTYENTQKKEETDISLSLNQTELKKDTF